MSKSTQTAVSTQEKIILGLQHVLAMFGATVLVPMLTGLDPAIAILSAGLGTLVFIYVPRDGTCFGF